MICSLSISAPAKSSNDFSVTSIIWSVINLEPSIAPCSGLLIQHSHSRTAHPSYPYWLNLEKIDLKSTCNNLPTEKNNINDNDYAYSML